MSQKLQTRINAAQIVQRLNVNIGPNRALYDKSMKLGTLLVYIIMNIAKIGGILDLSSVGDGGHFPKCPPSISNKYL